MKLRKRIFEVLMLLAALCLIAPAVQAADISVGGGIGFAPDYEGSKDYKVVPVPVADDYMQTYFGVSNRDSDRSGLEDYNADAGIKDVGITLALNWVITQNWSARSVGMYTQLLGDASDDSPVVDEGDEGQILGVVLAIYSF